MNIDRLMEKLYEIYEENDSDGSIEVTISTYSCGQTSIQALTEERIRVMKHDTGEVTVDIDAEDN